MFAGYGTQETAAHPSSATLKKIEQHASSSSHTTPQLNELEATSISGNDILSSAFYVSGLVTIQAGRMAPFCLLLVALVLYLFRGIYAETVTALPCNGGTYNILLNCTSKQFASLAACFAIIAYITTGGECDEQSDEWKVVRNSSGLYWYAAVANPQSPSLSRPQWSLR